MPYSYSYNFPALCGKQAGRLYYVAMCPLKLLPKLFLFDEAEVPPELRAQRTLNLARIPEISQYILDNRKDYAFSAITASIDGEVEFHPVSEGAGTSDLGELVVPMSARFIINDGQHRRAAIEAALEEQPDLGDETIAVVFYLDAGLQRSQQLFADLNKHAVRPSKSIGVLYDNRDPLACLAREIADQVPCFKGLVEHEKTTISNRSIKLFTLSGIYQATSALLEKRKNEPIDKPSGELAIRFWAEVSSIIPEWQLAAQRKVTSAELRRDYIHAHSVLLHALGIAGHSLIELHPHDWPHELSRFDGFDWLRSNSIWEGRAMIGGQMSKARQNVQLTACLLKTQLGLQLSSEEKRLEEKMSMGSKQLIRRPHKKNFRSKKH